MSFTWGAASTDANITSSTIAGNANLVSAAIASTGQAVTECGLILTYNASATAGGRVEILRTNDGGTTYQTASTGGANQSVDNPTAFNLPFTANTTVHYAFTVPATISQFKVNLANLDATVGHSITAATLKVSQATN